MNKTILSWINQCQMFLCIPLKSNQQLVLSGNVIWGLSFATRCQALENPSDTPLLHLFLTLLLFFSFFMRQMSERLESELNTYPRLLFLFPFKLQSPCFIELSDLLDADRIWRFFKFSRSLWTSSFGAGVRDQGTQRFQRPREPPRESPLAADHNPSSSPSLCP